MHSKAATVGNLSNSHAALQTTTLCDVEKFGEELKKTVEKYKDLEKEIGIEHKYSESPFGDPPVL